MAAVDAPARTIFLEYPDGTKKAVENIPSNAKVTFSNMIPKGDGRYGAPSGDRCLRIYTSENNQLAVFVGIKEFRDSTLSVKTKKETKKKRELVNEVTGEVKTFSDNMEIVEEWVEETF